MTTQPTETPEQRSDRLARERIARALYAMPGLPAIRHARLDLRAYDGTEGLQALGQLLEDFALYLREAFATHREREEEHRQLERDLAAFRRIIGLDR